MKRTIKLISIAAVGIILAGCAATQNTVNGLLGRDQGFNALDTNRDGVLSQDEAQALPDLAQAFNRVDTNNDSNINRNEFRAANTRIVAADFTQMDLNGDGVISKREATASRRSLREAFNTVDADQDGNVSTAEYRAATHNMLQQVSFDEADLDGDGVLDRKEVEEHPLVSAHFTDIDVNNDSLIGPDEFKWAQRQ
jgi:Ca2+-binding EF-hand superfamily protein